MKRFLALALSLAMVLSVCLFAGCGDTPESTTTAASTTPADTKPNETTSAKPQDSEKESTPADTTTGETTTNENPSETTTADTTPTETTEYTGGEVGSMIDYDALDGYSKLPGYEDIDFGGRTFVIVGREGSDEAGGGRWDNIREVYSDETDAISTAVRQRNDVIEKLYNCTIEPIASASPPSLATADVTGNQHTIDIYCTTHGIGTSVFTSDTAYNLLNYDIDFSHPWWDHGYTETYSVKTSSGNKVLYAAVGDFSFLTYAAVHILFYNKELKEATIPDIDLYELARTKQWTFDKFEEVLKHPAIAKDVNGNSSYSYTNDGDIVSWIRTDQSNHGIWAASGLSVVDSVDGVFSFACQSQGERWATVIERGISLTQLETIEYTSYSYVQSAIEEGKALFASEILDVLERMKDADVSVGIMPYPLFDEAQEDYSHFVTSRFPGYIIPISVPDPDTVATFFELYAYHSRYIVRTAFIDTYCVEYCGDAESAEMLDIILDTRTYDPGYMFWSAYETDISNMILAGKSTITQWVGRKGANLNKEIDKFVTDISDNKN